MQRKLQDIIISRKKARVARKQPKDFAAQKGQEDARQSQTAHEPLGRAGGRSRFRVKRRLFTRRFGGDAQDERKKSSKLFWIAGAVVILFLFAAFSTLFEKAILEITPKQTTLALDDSFEAVVRAKAEEGDLPFEIMTLELTESKEVPATEIKQIDRHASGRIVVYNDFDSRNQRLIKNTRFETPEGLIFRIRESIVVPGQRKAGGETVPGSVTVTVYADEPGEKYNVGHKDFTVPGFGGTPRFEHFYARSETEMTGGFSGVVKTISDEERRPIEEELKNAAREKLLANAHSEKPKESVLFDDAVFLSFEDGAGAEEEDVDKETVVVSEKALLRGVLFDRAVLSKHVAGMLLPDLTPEDSTMIESLEELQFGIEDKDSLAPNALEEITFTLEGNPSIVWQFDEEKLRGALTGKPKDQLREILAGFPSVIKAEVTIRPFWKRSFSEDPGDIEVRRVVEE